MKKLFLTFVLILIGLISFSQVTPTGEFRVADATTAWGVNLPLGTKIYNIATGDYWVLTAASLSTETLTTEADKTLLNPGETGWTIDGDAGDTEEITNQTVLFAGAGITTTSYSAASNTLTITSTEVDGSVTNEGSLSVTDGTNTADVVSNTSGSTNVTISGGTGISVEGSGSTITLAFDPTGTGVQTFITEVFEQSDDIADPFALAHDPKAETNMTVSLNGYELKADQFITVFGGSPTVTLSIPTYTYDRVVVSYTYDTP